MYYNREQIILASASPRRQQYLRDVGLQFTIHTAAIDEQPATGEEPTAFVMRMALEKAAAIRKHFPETWIVSGDTVVCLDRRILGKPEDAEEAVDLLMALSGREHVVRTGFCVTHGARRVEIVDAVSTAVRFVAFSEDTARAYVATGESLDKAGAYAIQGRGACLVKAIEGSYSNVVGLPICEVLQVLHECGVIMPGILNRAGNGVH